MSGHPPSADGDETPAVRVNDKRRFTPDGGPNDASTQPSATDAASPGGTNDELRATRAQHEALQRKFDELARAYQATERDKEDFKKRVQREREQLMDVERGAVAAGLLEAIDELDRCLSQADESPLATGVRLIRDGLLKRALAMGVERVPLEGRPFDPNLAEAADMELTTEPGQDNHVLSVLRACYQLKGRVVRPGQVKVARYMTPANA